MKSFKIIYGLLLVITCHLVHAQVTLLRGPYLQVATSKSIIIRWRTSIPSQSVVKYGGTRNFGLQKIDTVNTTEHQIALTGLAPHRKYFYSIGYGTTVLQSDTGNYFYTLPVAGSQGLYRIGVFGDCGNNSLNQMNVKKSVLNYLGDNYLDSWLLLGDNAYNSGLETEFQSNFFNIYKNDLLKKYPLWTTPGNHDYDNNLQNQLSHNVPYYSVFSMPTNAESGGVASNSNSYFSFDVGNIHFLSLDSYGLEDSLYRLHDTLSPQVQWVKKDLAANANKGWVVAFFHHPPYTMGSHNSDLEQELVLIRQRFLPILERYGVDLVLCGHSHVYERSAVMNGYYGFNKDFSTAYDLSTSKGLYNGSANSCPYIKDSSNKGTLYVVTGSAGQLGGTQTDFPLKSMQYSNATNGGALMLEVQANRLDAKWICADGAIRDQFTIMKDVNVNNTINITEGDTATLTASYIGNYSWSDSTTTSRTLQISPASGTYNFAVQDAYGCLKDSFHVIVSPALDSQIVEIRAGILNQTTNEVYWRTNKEINTNYFEVQYSADRLSFVTLATTKAQGDSNTSKTYYYNDEAFDPALSAFYYRVKTVFNNGKTAYSRTVRVVNTNVDVLHITDNDIVLAPNPAHFNEMRIKLNRNLSIVADVFVHDATGKLVSQKSMILTRGFQQFLPPLTAGAYFVTVKILNSIATKKMILY